MATKQQISLKMFKSNIHETLFKSHNYLIYMEYILPLDIFFFLQALSFKTKWLIEQQQQQQTCLINDLICLFLITVFKALELQCSSSHPVFLFARWN